MPDFTNFFGDFADELRGIYADAGDRFGDEHDEEPETETPECGGCNYYVPCDIEGYEGVGWCTLFGAFYTLSTPFDDCWEV